MKHFLVCFVCICYMCLLVSYPAWASCTEVPIITTDEELLKELRAIDIGNGFQVDTMLATDYVKAVLSSVYYVEETFLSFLISSEDDRWGFFDKQSYFLMAPQFDCVYDYYTTDIDSPIFCEQNEKFGYISRSDGTLIIPFVFSGYCELSEFFAGYALGCNIIVKEDETTFSYELLRSDGTAIQFPEGIIPISHPYGNLVLISTATGTCGNADTEDKSSVGIGNIDGEVLISPVECFDSSVLESYFYPYQDLDYDYE